MHVDQILPQLFVGACPCAPVDIDSLKTDFGITAVLNLQTDEDFSSWHIKWHEMEAAYLRRSIKLRRVPVQDFNPEELRQKLPACVQALNGLVRAGHAVYVHCNAGVNRSPSVVVAYLHWVQKMSFNEAVAYVLNRHPSDPYVETIWLATEDRAAGG